MPSTKVILNPVAGRGAAGNALPRLKQLLTEAGIEYDLILTYRPWHAAELAHQAVAAGFTTVVAVGGDGTMNEVLNGLLSARAMGLGDARLATIPIGRGNDFSFGMDAPLTLEEACKALAAGQTRRIDVGRVSGGDYPEGRYFGNGIGVGFDTVVGFEAAKLKKVRGFAAYLIGALRTMRLYYTAPLLKIELDGELLQQPCLMVSIMNGRRMGGGFMMAPTGRPDDGLLNLCVVDYVKRRNILPLIVRFTKGTQGEHPQVKMLQSRRIAITALNGSLPVHADGETICTAGSHLDVEIFPAHIDLVVNPAAQA